MSTVNLEPINLGVFANDGTGDDLRTAFEKVNANFSDIQNTLPSKLIEDPSPTLGANLNLNGKNLSSTSPVTLNTSKFIISGDVQATNFLGPVNTIGNHRLTGLLDVEYINEPVNEDGLVFRDGIWQPGPVHAAFSTVDGGAASTVFIDDLYAIVDGGYADDSI